MRTKRDDPLPTVLVGRERATLSPVETHPQQRRDDKLPGVACHVQNHAGPTVGPETEHFPDAWPHRDRALDRDGLAAPRPNPSHRAADLKYLPDEGFLVVVPLQRENLGAITLAHVGDDVA